MTSDGRPVEDGTARPARSEGKTQRIRDAADTADNIATAACCKLKREWLALLVGLVLHEPVSPDDIDAARAARAEVDR